MYEYVPYVDVYMFMTNLKTTVTKMYVITVNLLGKTKGKKMIAIKDMKMPKYCWGYDIESKKWKECPIYKGCKHHSSNIETMPSDCPLVEIQPLTDQEQFKAKSKEIIDNEQFGGFGKLFDYDNIDEICVAQVDDINNAVASYPLMEFLDSLYEQIKENLK